MPISNAERTRLFGPPGNVERTTFVTPWGDRCQVHKLVIARFAYACNDAYRESGWKPRRIDSYNPRTIRGSTAPSLHGWALAWDFFATDEGVPPPGGVWKPANTVPEDFARCFIRQGFKWGRYFSRQDWPHIEWAEGRPSEVPDQPATPLLPPTYYPKDKMTAYPKRCELGADGSGYDDLFNVSKSKLVSIVVNGADPKTGTKPIPSTAALQVDGACRVAFQGGLPRAVIDYTAWVAD